MTKKNKKWSFWYPQEPMLVQEELAMFGADFKFWKSLLSARFVAESALYKSFQLLNSAKLDMKHSVRTVSETSTRDANGKP